MSANGSGRSIGMRLQPSSCSVWPEAPARTADVTGNVSGNVHRSRLEINPHDAAAPSLGSSSVQVSMTNVVKIVSALLLLIATPACPIEIVETHPSICTGSGGAAPTLEGSGGQGGGDAGAD